MKRLLTTAAAAVLLMTIGACASSSDSSDPDPAAASPTPYDATTATDEEQWAHFEELATEADVDPANYPATAEEAEAAAQALCGRTAEDVAGIDALMTSVVGEEKYAAEMEAELFFLEAYCPEQVAVFQEGHELPPPKPKKG